MKMEHKIAQRIIKNVFLSLLIYALPIVLMWLTFYFTGQRPWVNHDKSSVNETNIVDKK